MFDTNLNEFYSYVFGSRAEIVISNRVTDEALIKKITSEKQQAAHQKFSFITDNPELSTKFRALLRHYRSTHLETHLYGSSTDELDKETRTVIPSDEEIQKKFEEMNEQAGYFNDNDLNSFTTLFKLSKLMCEFELRNNGADNDMAYQYAYKLLVLFSLDEKKDKDKDKDKDKRTNPFLSIEKHLEALKTDGSEMPLHDALLAPIPSIKDIESFDLAAWRIFIKNNGKTAIDIFARSADITKAGKKVPSSIEEARRILGELTYKQATRDPELAAMCIEYNISEELFDRCLELIKLRKEKDTLPDLIIDGTEHGQKGYYLVKLPIKDPRAFILGYITRCCQSIGGHSERCVIDGISLTNNGFYVMLRQKQTSKNKKNVSPKTLTNELNYEDFEILGQGYMWRDKDKNIVLDSWENKYTKHDAVVTPLIRALGKQIVETYPETIRVTIGQGGKTPKELRQNSVPPGRMLEGIQYGDSTSQGLIYLDENKILTRLQPLINTLKTLSDSEHFDELMTPNYIYPERYLSFLENIINQNPDNISEIFNEFLESVLLGTIGIPDYLVDLWNAGLADSTNLKMGKKYGLDYVNCLLILKSENLLSPEIFKILQSKTRYFSYYLDAFNEMKNHHALHERNISILLNLSIVNDNLAKFECQAIVNILIQLTNENVDISEELLFHLVNDKHSLQRTIDQLINANLLSKKSLEMVLEGETYKRDQQCRLWIALNQVGMPDLSLYLKLNNIFICTSEFNTFLSSLEELHKLGLLKRYINEILSISNIENISSLFLPERILEFIKTLILLQNNNINNLTPEEIEILKNSDSLYHTVQKLDTNNALNQLTFNLMIRSSNENHRFICEGIVKLASLNLLQDNEIHILLSADRLEKFGCIFLISLAEYPDIKFSKSDIFSLFQHSGEYYHALHQLRCDHLLTSENIRALLDVDTDIASFTDNFISEKRLAAAKSTFLATLSPLLGDGRNGNRSSLKQDKFQSQSDIVYPSYPFMTPVSRLQALEMAFDKIYNNIDTNGSALYTRQNNSYFLFFLTPRRNPISETQRNHIGLLKKEYLDILRFSVSNEELLRMARDSRLINFNRTYYANWENSITASRNEVEKLITLHDKNCRLL